MYGINHSDANDCEAQNQRTKYMSSQRPRSLEQNVTARAPIEPSPRNAATIFVAIPAFRDPECQRTIANLFAQAKEPERIHVGICAQYSWDEDSTSCFVEPVPRPTQVKILRLDAADARGPSWARYLTQKLYDGEAYYLQIDSHTRFTKDWDDQLIGFHSQCVKISSHGKAIITSYPAGYSLSSGEQVSLDERPTILRATTFDDDGFLRLKSTIVEAVQDSCPQQDAKCVRSLFWAAGFAFTSGSAIADCPYDPHHKSLFFGEEQCMSARLWTHGYDFYAPPKQVTSCDQERRFTVCRCVEVVVFTHM